MTKILVISEKPNQLVELAGFAQELKKLDPNIETIGVTFANTVEEVKKYSDIGIKRIYYAISEHVFPAELAKISVEVFHKENPILMAGLALKNINETMSRIAGLLKIPMFTEIININITGKEDKIERLVLGGSSILRVKSSLPITITVPARKFEAQKTEGETEFIQVSKPESKIKIIKTEEKQRGAVNIEEAEIVVGVGRGFKKKEDIQMAEELAEVLNGAVGASRPIVADYGWLPEDAWIGISGKKIRPKLYLAIGISGAPQHITAAMDSKLIIAINNDKNAPIFQYSDYGIVGDLYKILPILIGRLKEKRK